MKKRKSKIILVVVFVLFLVLALLVPGTVQASGLVNLVQDASHQYSQYNLENYDLDFYVDMSWTWLPWNWTDGISRGVMHGLYAFTNAIWKLSRLISCGTGEIVTEAYRFDIINELADSIGANIQRLAGVSSSGFSSEGFYPGFIMWIIVILGIYVAYVGVYKRETSKALSAVASTVLIFVFTTALIVYAPTLIKDVNEFSTDISTGALDLATGLVIPGADTGEGDSVDKIRDQLFNIQIYQPWLILQFGTSDVNVIGADRVNNLLSVSPDAEYGQTRENVVKNEIETYGNMNLTTTKVMSRFGDVIFVLFVNLLISVFVILLSGMMIITQLLFIVYTMFLVIAFVLSMFPTYNGMLKKALLKVFNVIMLRAGYMLIITITFMISSMIYSIADNHSFITIGFLQIIVYAGIFLNKNEILEFMSLKSDRGVTMLGGAGAALAYRRMRRAENRHEQKVERKRRRRAEKREQKWDELKGKAWNGIKDGYEQTRDRRALSYMREQAAQKSWKTAQMKQNGDYVAAENTPNVQGADFYWNRSQKDASSGQIYDKYLNRMHGRDLGRADKLHYGADYHAARQTPGTRVANFNDPVKVTESNKYRRPELWQGHITGDAVRERYQGNTYKPGEIDVQPMEGGATRKFHVAKRIDTPQLERVRREGVEMRSTGRGTARISEPRELETISRVRTQEEIDMGTKTSANGNWKRTSSNWRTGGSQNLKMREGSRSTEGRGSKGNWRGQ